MTLKYQSSSVKCQNISVKHKYAVSMLKAVLLQTIQFRVIWPIDKTLSYLPTPPLGQDMTQGQSSSKV